MIRFVEGRKEQESFRCFCQGSAFGCRLAATARAYGFDRSFARFWLGDGAAYCLLDGVLSVAGSPEDLEEARAFAGAVGAQSVFCSRALAASWELDSRAWGKILVKQNALTACEVKQTRETPEVLEIWKLLTEAGMELDREAFHLDLSHRLRHGAALAIGTRDAHGHLCGCAVATLAENEATLTALAVREDCRRKGLGSRLVREMEAALPGKRLYVLRAAGENQAFYAGLGYEETDEWQVAGVHHI